MHQTWLGNLKIVFADHQVVLQLLQLEISEELYPILLMMLNAFQEDK